MLSYCSNSVRLLAARRAAPALGACATRAASASTRRAVSAASVISQRGATVPRRMAVSSAVQTLAPRWLPSRAVSASWHAVPAVYRAPGFRFMSTVPGDGATAATATAAADDEDAEDAAAEPAKVVELGADATDPDGVIPILIRIQEIVKADLEFPRFIVVGNQSAGKTSALEALIGMDILPKGNHMVTRRPLEVTMVRTETGKWVEIGGEKYYDFDEVKQVVLEENLSVEVSSEPVRIKVFGPHFHNLTLVDLPGYINAIKPGMSRSVPESIKDMIQPFIDDQRNIMLVVCSATEDLANSMGLARAQQADHTGERSMGVVTKCDLPKYKSTLIETLQNRNFPLGLGYVGVRCRTQTELEAGMDFDELVVKEAEFFETSGITSHPGVRAGMPLLRSELSATLLRKISHDFPSILQKLDDAIEEVRKSESFLETLSREKDLKTVSRELEMLVNQLHPAAASRRDFEKTLRSKLAKMVKGMWRQSCDAAFTFDPDERVKDMPVQAGNVRDEARSLLTALGHEFIHDYPTEASYPPLLMYGGGPLQSTNPEDLHHHKTRAICQGALGAYYTTSFPDDLQRRHRDWHRNLQDTVDLVLTDHNIVQASFDMLLRELKDFADNAQASRKDQSKINLARLFFRYLLEKIATRIHGEGLSETAFGMVDREKRPYAEFSQIVNELVAEQKHPENMSWFFGDNNSQKEVIMYGKDWTRAYFNVVAKRTGDDLFRIFSVRLLEQLVFESISYSLTLFRQDKIAKEAGKQSDYLAELEHYRRVLVAASERYVAHKL